MYVFKKVFLLLWLVLLISCNPKVDCIEENYSKDIIYSSLEGDFQNVRIRGYIVPENALG